MARQLSQAPRNVKRRERYRELRALGFSSPDADKLRSRSGDNIENAISVEQRRISRKPVQTRTSTEVFRLNRIRFRKTAQPPAMRSGRMDSRRARWQKFSQWSKANKFPRLSKERIVRINTAAGRPSPDDGYGYRRYYFEYVERLSPADASDLSDRNDSGVKWMDGESLVRGRVNLRSIFNPYIEKQSKAS